MFRGHSGMVQAGPKSLDGLLTVQLLCPRLVVSYISPRHILLYQIRYSL